MSVRHQGLAHADPHSDTGFRLLTRFAMAAGVAALVAVSVAITRPSEMTFPALPEHHNEQAPPLAIMVAVVLAGVLASWVLVEGTRLKLSMSVRRAVPLRDVVSIASLLSVIMVLPWILTWIIYEAFLGDRLFPAPRSTAWGVPHLAAFGGWVLILLVMLFSWIYRRAVKDAGRRATVRYACWAVIVALLLLPLTWDAVYFYVSSPPDSLLWCVPASAFALWGIHVMQRHRRLPFRALLAAFGWGASVAIGVSTVNRVFLTFAPSPLGHMETFRVGLSLDAGIFEEFFKGAGIAIVYLLRRRWFDNVASGVVIGAAVGLGFNFNESIQYMTGDAGLQFWNRQTVGMMTSHVAFSALVGAGFGIAAGERTWRRKRQAVAAGYLSAVCGHFINNYVMWKGSGWFSLSSEPLVSVLVLYPTAILVLQGPALVMYIVLLRKGLKEQAAALAQELPGEARCGHGAVTRVEVPVLLSPRLRFGQRIRAFRSGGVSRWRQTGRLQAAQIDLAIHRWHRTRGDTIGTLDEEVRLREKVLRLKAMHRPLPATRLPAGVPV